MVMVEIWAEQLANDLCSWYLAKIRTWKWNRNPLQDPQMSLYPLDSEQSFQHYTNF